jgi:hypothetical protein
VNRSAIEARLTGDRGQPLVPLTWWAAMDQALSDPAILITLLQLVRQAGKSTGLARRLTGDLLTVPHSASVFVSAGREQGEAIFARKFRGPIRRLLQAAELPATTVRMTKNTDECPALDSWLEVVTPSEATAPSRSVTMLALDEAKNIPDEVFAALAPSVLAAGGKILVASTPGTPRGFFHDLATSADPSVRVLKIDGNQNPCASESAIGLLRRLLWKILPSAARRDLENEFTEDAAVAFGDDALAALVDRGWEPAVPYDPDLPEAHIGIDVGLRSDNAAAVMVCRNPEGAEVIVCRHRIWRPVGRETLDIAGTLEAFVRELCAGYRVATIRIDPWQAERSIQQLRSEGLPIEPFPQTPQNLVRMAMTLLDLVKYRNLVLYPGADDLMEHLRNVAIGETSYGVKLAKEKSSRKVDGAIALAIACVAAIERPVRPPVAVW